MVQRRNVKIRNATQTKDKGITFKSQAEKTIYRTLLEKNIKPKYESKTFVLWDGFIPITPFYDEETETQRDKRIAQNPESGNSKLLVRKMDKVIGIRYTPDFYFKVKDVDVWIEVKGIENDVFYIKKKLFRKYLDNLYQTKGKRSVYFEIHTKRQLLQALEIINEYAYPTTNNQESAEVSS